MYNIYNLNIYSASISYDNRIQKGRSGTTSFYGGDPLPTKLTKSFNAGGLQVPLMPASPTGLHVFDGCGV